ncbi:uncharacterized protein LOC125050080 isoform X2 [Pieris napi]|uniref:uncharacterized protein LOC125050080 isoform X2 n=1 Tax=Pieris napi TaxID=78633 RepID=UPI001FB9689E|nr:uncharacterized protein LOC125050080 isoform X2 [Pieris napi]
MKVYKSENIQVGSRSKMLSPLNVNVNAVEVEEAPTGTYREITPEMIHEALRRLTMWRQNVETGAIYDFIQRNYPVNQDKEALAVELWEKLEVAVLVGIATQTSIDTWTLCGALERPKFNDTHVTLFWKVYRDTMSPLNKPNKTMDTSKDTSEKQTLRVYDVDVL